MSDTIEAVVQKVVEDGRHGPFAVADSETIDGSVTFSLKPDVWQEEEWPEEGTIVVLSDLVKKRGGWRAKKARLFQLVDEQREKEQKAIEQRERSNKMNDLSKLHFNISVWPEDSMFGTGLGRGYNNRNFYTSTDGEDGQELFQLKTPEFGSESYTYIALEQAEEAIKALLRRISQRIREDKVHVENKVWRGLEKGDSFSISLFFGKQDERYTVELLVLFDSIHMVGKHLEKLQSMENIREVYPLLVTLDKDFLAESFAELVWAKMMEVYTRETSQELVACA